MIDIHCKSRVNSYRWWQKRIRNRVNFPVPDWNMKWGKSQLLLLLHLLDRKGRKGRTTKSGGGGGFWNKRTVANLADSSKSVSNAAIELYMENFGFPLNPFVVQCLSVCWGFYSLKFRSNCATIRARAPVCVSIANVLEHRKKVHRTN
jgi:hypothetical protein